MSNQIKDFLVWVGGGSYSRESMIKEAKKMGVCRRVPFVPEGIVKGITRVFLVSDMSDEDRKRYAEEMKRRDAERYQQWKKQLADEVPREEMKTTINRKMPRGTPFIFGYFIVRGISYVVSPNVDIPKRLKELGVTEYQYIEGAFGFNDERECGSLEIGGTYLLSENDMEKVKDLAESSTMEGRIVELKPMFAYSSGRFRGIKEFSRKLGDKIIEQQEE